MVGEGWGVKGWPPEGIPQTGDPMFSALPVVLLGFIFCILVRVLYG